MLRRRTGGRLKLKFMKKTNDKGHRWTNEQLKELMALWEKNESLEVIAHQLSSTQNAVAKMVVRLRSNGIPLTRRNKGHRVGRHDQSWTQAEVEYLVRRRHQQATSEAIAFELGRSISAISAMIQKLRSESVNVPMLGCGVRRLWDSNMLKGSFANEEEKVLPLKDLSQIATA